MNNRNVESHLRAAVTNTVPDVLNNILSECEDRKGKVIEMKTKTTDRNWVKPLCATAAALALIVGGVFGAGHLQSARAIDSVVSLDVNPSIQIEANKNDKVISVKGLNEDGESILKKEAAEGTKLEGEQLEAVAKELIASMVEEGYLTELANSVLVSVDNADPEKGAAIESILMEAINSALTEQGVDGAVIGQTIGNNEELAAMAEKLGISTGKASLISAIIEKQPELGYEELADLSINDLSLIVEKWADSSDSINIVGTPSDKKYVSADFAIENACANANVAVGDIVGAEAQIGYVDGKLVYGVKVNVGGSEVVCNVDANSGEVISIVTAVVDATIGKLGNIINNGTGTGTGSGTGTGTTGGATAKPDYEKVITDVITGAVGAVVDEVAPNAATGTAPGANPGGASGGTSGTGVNDIIKPDGANYEDIITDAITGTVDAVTDKTTGGAIGDSGATTPNYEDVLTDIITGGVDKITSDIAGGAYGRK